MKSDEPECTRHGNVAVLRSRARVLGTPTEATQTFREEFHRLVSETECDIVLDLLAVEAITKSTLMLVLADKAMKPRGRRLVLCLGPALHEVFRTARLDHLFPCFTDLAGALAGLARPRVNDHTPSAGDEG